MAKQDLKKFETNEFVLHFGGEQKSINAITFGNALVSFSKAILSICQEIDPKLDVEITVEAVGHGSFRVLLKLSPLTVVEHIVRNAVEDISNDFVAQVFAAFMEILASEYVETKHHDVVTIDRRIERITEPDGRRVEREEEGVSIPADIYEKIEKARINSELNRHVSRAVKAIQADSNIREFGICRNLEDRKPILKILEHDFPTILKNTELRLDKPIVHENVMLTVRVPVLVTSKRQWEFLWNKFRIVASVSDEAFLNKLKSGEISVRMGDKYSADLLEYRSHDKKITKYNVTNLRGPGDRQ